MSTTKPPRQQSRHLPAFVLLCIAEAPMHGGALQSTLNERLPSLKADSAAIYRTLKKLEKDGEVESTWTTPESGPAIRVYTITPTGWEKLDQWRADIEERRENLNHFLTTYAHLKEQPKK